MTETEQFLELFSRTLNFFAPITAYYFLDRTRLFWPNARFEQTILALDARALLMLNYDKPSRIFSCLLLTRNHMIFLVQFGINKHLLIFSKTTNCTRPTGSCNFVSLWKNLLVLIYSKLHLKSCDYLYKIAWNELQFPLSCIYFGSQNSVAQYKKLFGCTGILLI